MELYAEIEPRLESLWSVAKFSNDTIRPCCHEILLQKDKATDEYSVAERGGAFGVMGSDAAPLLNFGECVSD